jgi:hypothetical protein
LRVRGEVRLYSSFCSRSSYSWIADRHTKCDKTVNLTVLTSSSKRRVFYGNHRCGSIPIVAAIE